MVVLALTPRTASRSLSLSPSLTLSASLSLPTHPLTPPPRSLLPSSPPPFLPALLPSTLRLLQVRLESQAQATPTQPAGSKSDFLRAQPPPASASEAPPGTRRFGAASDRLTRTRRCAVSDRLCAAAASPPASPVNLKPHSLAQLTRTPPRLRL
eukprot:705909-Rhodomonas_salina.1